MLRFVPILGIITGLIFGLFFFALLGRTNAPIPTSVSPNASSTLLVTNDVPTATTSTQTAPTPEPKKDTPPKTSPAPIPTTPAPATPAPVPVVAPIPSLVPTAPPPPSGNAALDAAATVLRAALVNILCYVPVGSALHSISGSGIFVDSKGVILTNAHIAQYFLLADRNVSCTIRSGSPAADRYEASLIYISPIWLQKNPNVLTQTLPNGNGEYDFAFLAVSKSATRNSLPDSFPFISLATTPPTTGTPVVIASYGAQFLATSQVQSSLFPTIVFGSIKDVFTFGTNTIDVLALGGSAAAQEGSSGGGVADASGALVGTITTSTVTGATDTRSLDAITASYIRAEYASETGSALDILLSQSAATAISNFTPQLSSLEAIITANL